MIKGGMKMKKITLITAILALLVTSSGLWAAEKNKLTEEEALQMIQDYKSQESSLKSEISKLEKELQNLNLKINELTNKVTRLRNEIKNLKDEIAKYPSEYTVVKGDCLYKIAAKRYIYNNAAAWPRIYRANRDLIKDPNLIYPGWVLKIPHGLDRTITVIPGDCLWKIAGFYWIYNNPKEWTKIYEANRDKIKDPDLIYPGQVLDIPRD